MGGERQSPKHANLWRIRIKKNASAYYCLATKFKYHLSYEWLMPVWFKFRDLKNSEHNSWRGHTDLCGIIRAAMMNEDIIEAFNEIVRAILWYNAIKQEMARDTDKINKPTRPTIVWP